MAILDKDLLDEINGLYDFRNKVIHRFLISEIEYAHLELVLDRYELLFQQLWTAVYNLEAEQIRKKVGMTVVGRVTKHDRENAYKDILKKIDTKDSEKLKRILGAKLIKDMETFSKVDERERVAFEIEEELEVQREKSKIPSHLSGLKSVKEITTWARRKGLFEECTCGHIKSTHIDLNESQKPVTDYNSYAKKCRAEECICKSFVKVE